MHFIHTRDVSLDHGHNPADTAGTRDARSWTQILLRYREPSGVRSLLELGITLGPLAGLWVLMWASYYFGFWWVTLLLAVPTAGFLVRLFMIQHDCGHGAFFRHRLANDWIGRALGVLTFTPYDFWRRTHAMHHATSGNLHRRGIGDIDTLTVREYLALSRLGRLRYRLYRHPAVMFGVGPAYLFIFQHRLPVGLMRGGWVPWASTMGTNLAIAAIVAALMWLIGVWAFLLVHGPIVLLAAAIGVWLFYVQHQFEGVYWERGQEWDYEKAALQGSSYYKLPPVLQWFSGNIGFHHIHHLSPRIPNYHLERCHRTEPLFQTVKPVTLLSSFKCLTFRLWDERRRRMVGYPSASGKVR